MAKVRTLIDEAANEVATEKLPRSEAKAVVKVRSNFKIYESADFTAQEKLDLIGAKDRKNLANYYYSTYEAADKAKNYELALNHINKAIELDPTNAKFYHKKALIEYYDLDQIEQAIETMKKAARYNDNADFTLYEDDVKEWSEELRYLKEKQAQEAARQAELRQQEEARLKAEQEAARQAELARQEKARLRAEQEAARQADFQAELSQRVNEKMLTKDYKGAIEDYSDLIKIDEKGYYYYRRAEAYLKTGQKDLAKADYKKGIELDPRSVLRDSHDFDGLKAELKIEKAQEYSQKAKNSMQIGDNLTAIEFAKTALRYDPSNSEYKVLLNKAKKAATAEEYYARALEYEKYRHIQLAYKDFEMAINKATDKALKVQYSFEQARLLRYAKGRGKEGNTIHNEKSNRLISYSEAALRSYDRAVEYASSRKVKVQYLLERADFKRFNKDFEGAKADTKLAKELEETRIREGARYKTKKEAESKDNTL